MNTLRDELREKTDGAHRQLEDRLGLLERVHSHSEYLRILSRFLGVYRPLEERLGAFQFQPFLQTLEWWDLRRKCGALESDLQYLGLSPQDLARIPSCPVERLPRLETLSQVAGCLYVLEGSTLGGQVITRSLAPRLGLAPEKGFRFFSGHGPQTGPLWKEFCEALSQGDWQADEAVQAALETFACLESWLCDAEG